MITNVAWRATTCLIDPKEPNDYTQKVATDLELLHHRELDAVYFVLMVLSSLMNNYKR